MDRETKALSTQTSSMPPWLQDKKAAAFPPSAAAKRAIKAACHGPRAAAEALTGGLKTALHSPKHHSSLRDQKNSSKPAKSSKIRGFVVARTKPGTSSYHNMSLDMIHSLAPERPESRSACRPISRLETGPKISDGSSTVSNRPSSRAESKKAADSSQNGKVLGNMAGTESQNAADSSQLGKVVSGLDSNFRTKSKAASDSIPDDAGRKAAAAEVQQANGSSLVAAKKRHAAFGSSVGMHGRNSIAAVAGGEKEPQHRSSKAGSVGLSKSALSVGKAGGSPRLTAAKRQTTFQFEDLSEGDEDVQQSRRGGVLLSQASLTHQVIQQLDFTGSYQANDHMFLEVGRLLLFLLQLFSVLQLSS